MSELAVADHFSEFYLTGSAAPLPVELVEFTATRQPAAVRLAWRTASERNSARFEIERSADGVAFSQLDAVTAAGSSAIAHTYAWPDGQPLPSRGYYRLRLVDQDGTATYSPVRVVETAAPAGPIAYPVPARAGQLLTVAGLPAGATAEVFDAVGRRVAAAPLGTDGTATLALPAGLAAGVYIVRAGATAIRLSVE